MFTSVQNLKNCYWTDPVYRSTITTCQYNHSLYWWSTDIRDGFHEVGDASIYHWQEIIADPAHIVVLNLKFVNDQRASLDAVSAKHWKIIVHDRFANCREV